MTVWVVIFTVLVFWAVRQNREAVNAINHDKASIVSLEKTNCALKEFLAAAEAARLHTAGHESGSQKQSDLRAARGYHKLAQLFPQDGCQHALRGH
jgi:hypothetical protein